MTRESDHSLKICLYLCCTASGSEVMCRKKVDTFLVYLSRFYVTDRLIRPKKNVVFGLGLGSGPRPRPDPNTQIYIRPRPKPKHKDPHMY